MSDWRDVMESRSKADALTHALDNYGASIEDGRTSDPALGATLAALAICAELRSLSTVIDYNGSAICNSVGRE